MGREIRRVPPGWEHPRDERGNYKPMFDRSLEEAAAEWKSGYGAWEPAAHEGQQYWEYAGNPPDPECYRPDWPEETRTAWQVYETVSEGTPVSPVFLDQEEMVRWLIAQGHSDRAA